MREGLAAGDADHGGAKAAEMVDAAEHLVCWHGRGDLVELVAVSAGEIAEARGDDLDEDGMGGRGEGARDHCVLAGFARGADGATTDRVSAEFGHLFYFTECDRRAEDWCSASIRFIRMSLMRVRWPSPLALSHSSTRGSR